jgi:hypothetical protein
VCRWPVPGERSAPIRNLEGWRKASTSRSRYRVFSGNQAFMRRTTISCSLWRAPSSLACKGSPVSGSGFDRTAATTACAIGEEFELALTLHCHLPVISPHRNGERVCAPLQFRGLSLKAPAAVEAPEASEVRGLPFSSSERSPVSGPLRRGTYGLVHKINVIGRAVGDDVN